MGCGQSKAATQAVLVSSKEEAEGINDKKSRVATRTTGEDTGLTGSTLKLSEECVNPCGDGKQCAATPNGTKSTLAGGGGGGGKTTTTTKKNNIMSVADRRNEYAVRPGYSSGASSYDGSVTGEDDEDMDGMGGGTPGRDVRLDELAVSRHSDILALGTLRQDIVAEGDLTKTVVRIETAFGQPIEEVYDGVHDGPVLGSGVSGIVRLVVHKATKIKYAVKVLETGLIDSTEALVMLRNEIFVMCQLDHPNIVRIEEVYESTNEIYIVQELCLGGDLFDRLDEQPDFHYTEPQCARLVKQMLSSVRYLHSKGIIHRDLKLENFLFSSTKADSELKMIDFGLSKHFIMGQHHNEQVGTPYTVAPEIILGHYDEKSDIWSLGVITYLLLSGETPFGGLDGENLLLVKQNIMRAQLQFEPADVWENVSADAIAFVKNLLKQDPLQRPTAKRAQKDNWIQIWAKKDTKSAKLNTKTINALMQFKEQSDMQKLLSEVLSFTLLPEQIVDLRSEFEKIDKDGDGEISLMAMKSVLMQNAEAGALGALTENEVEMLFESIRVRKHEPTIRWHEFLAAGLSQARVDDRNLRLAFDRMDTNRKGYITFEDLRDLLGNSAESDLLERVWMETLQECKAHLDRITYEDFLVLMKGQAKKDHSKPPPTGPGTSLKPVHETATLQPVQEGVPIRPSLAEELQTVSNPRHKKTRSQSLDQNSSLWNGSDDEASASGSLTHDGRRAGRAILLPGQLPNKEKALDNSMSPLLANRALYRMHREMRIAVLEASKTFDRVRNERSSPEQAGLIMKRGAKPPVELQDKHNREMYEAAAKRCGRARRTRNKTVSDVTGMIIHHQYNTAK